MTMPLGPYVCDGLLWQAEGLVLPWMAARIEGMEGQAFGCPGFPARAIGVLKGDAIVGGVAYSFWFDHPDGGDVQISMVMERGARVTRRMWRHLYGHAFTTMNCRRMSLQILKRNRKARKHVEDAGFRVEGKKEEGYGRQDVILYRLLRSEMRDGLPPLMRVRQNG